MLHTLVRMAAEPLDLGGLMVFLWLTMMLILLFVVAGVSVLIGYICRGRAHRFSEEERLRAEENRVYLELELEDQEIYFQLREYLDLNPPITNAPLASEQTIIQERGVQAWEFIRHPALTADDVVVLNKTELNFFSVSECLVQTNHPVPRGPHDVYYYEAKIFYLPEQQSTTVLIGLAHKPYPYFRLPGRHPVLVAYDSTGHRRFRQPFPMTDPPPFAEIRQGDVIGVGYRPRLSGGTIFFTRNGRRVKEHSIGGHILGITCPLYPTIGVHGVATVHVNLGQMGFVHIEANVKKWGYGPLEGSGPAPPQYDAFNKDIILERSDVDPDDLEQRANDFPPDFWQSQTDSDFAEHITLATLDSVHSLPEEPPEYGLDEEAEVAGAVGEPRANEPQAPGTETNVPDAL